MPAPLRARPAAAAAAAAAILDVSTVEPNAASFGACLSVLCAGAGLVVSVAVAGLGVVGGFWEGGIERDWRWRSDLTADGRTDGRTDGRLRRRRACLLCAASRCVQCCCFCWGEREGSSRRWW